MTISKRKLTAFSRWMNRFHRSKGLETPIFYLTRSTFDLMRLTTEERSESDIALKIREMIRSIGDDSREMPHSRFSMWDNNCVLVPSITDPEDSERDLGGMIAMRADASEIASSMEDFDGEHDFDDIPIVILHHGYWGEAESYQECGLAESLLQGMGPKLANPLTNMRINDFEGSMVKLGPTEILMNGDGVEDALDLIRCQISEVRVSDDPEAVSREQSESMNMVRVVDSPAINLTGRPGTGKTTVAQITVPEVLLQRGPRRFERNVLYLTTTNKLKSEARTEIDNIIQHVYGVKGPQYEMVDEQITDHVEYLTRDNLISSHPSDKESLDLAIDQIAEDALGLSHGEVGLIKKKWKSIQENWLVPERRSELKRVLSNLVFGLFGSREIFASWFDRNLEIHKAEGVWREIFSGTKLNLYEPWKTEFDPQQVHVRTIEEEKIHPNLLQDFWDPFLGVDYKTGMDRIESLTNLVSLPEVGGRLFGSDGSGHWTHASIMNKIDLDIESGREKGKGIWSGGNQNKFDAIVIDESQDFTVRELAIVLKRFANRGVTKKAEVNAKDYAPFLFLASGDPLQTIEGSLFGPRNTHINNLYEDWKSSIRKSTRENPVIDIEADVQLNNMTHKELRANHRNAQPIVEFAVNPIIEKMRSDAHDQLGIVRTIYDQTAVSSRRGFVLRWEDEEIEEDRDKRYAENIWRISTERVIQQIDSIIESQDTVSKKVTVGLILPVDDITNEEEVLDAIPEDLANGEVKKKVAELFGKMAPGQENRKWNEKTMYRAGVFNVKSIKGLTLECTIAAGFGDRIQQDEGPYEMMTRYSHYLVACSRPQFVLLLYEEGKHPNIPGMRSSLFRKDRDVDDEEELVDLRNLLNRVEVNLDPTILLDDALKYPESKKFWDLTINSLEALREKKGGWSEAIELVSFLEKMNRRFHQKKPNFTSARNMVSDVLDDDSRKRLSIGAKSLRRPELVTPNGSDKDPLYMIQTYLDWRAFLDDELPTPTLGPNSMLDGNAKNWAKIRNDGPEIKAIRGIIKSERDTMERAFLFHPDWSGKYPKRIPKRPEQQDCVVNIEIPDKYLFRGEKYPMVQENVWSTPYELLRGLIDRFRKEKLPDYAEYSDEDWEREDWSGLADLEERLLDVEWYLTASRKPEELVEIILREKRDNEHRAISGVDWIFDILSKGIRTEDESEKDENLSNAVRRWASREKGREQLLELFRGWIDRKGLKVNPDRTTVLDDFEQVMGEELLKSIFTDKSSKEWVTEQITSIIKRSSEESSDSEISIGDAALLLEKIQKHAIDENKKYSRTILELLKAIQNGKGAELKEWLIGGSLDYLVRFNGKAPDVTEASIRVLIDQGLSNPGIASEMYSRWFGSRLRNVWAKGRWKDSSAKEVVDLFIRLTGGPAGQKPEKKIIGRSLSEHLANVLSSAVEPKLVSFSEELFEDCVEAGGIPDTADHLVLKYFLWLNLPKKDRRSSKIDPFVLYKFVDSVAKSGKPDLSKVYREGHNYWNGLTTKDDFSTDGNSLRINCEDRHRRQIRRTMLAKGMISERAGEVTEFGLREDRIAPPSEIIQDGRRFVTQFSNTNPGIQGYLSIRPNGSKMAIKTLRDCHWNFRLAGAYRESAIASLCEGVILAMDPEKADDGVIFDMLYFQEMQRRVERSLGRARRNGPVSNPGDFRKRARKTEKEKLTRIFKEMSDSEKRRALVMKSLRNAIDERPGTYIDHVMVTRNWARKTSNDFEFFRLSLRDSTTKRLFLSVKDDSIIPIGMKPIGFRDRGEYRGLSILEDETKKELGEIIDGSRDNLSDRGTIVESQEFTANPQRRFSCRKDKDHSEIRRLYRELLSSMSPYQAVEELPLITGEKRADIEAKPAKIVGSTRRLIPYILLAEETDRDFKKIKSVTWFKTPKNPTDFEFWEGDNILEDLVREDVIEILSEEGDAWILEIFELVRGIDAASKWGKSEILDLQEAIIKSAPTEGLRRMSEAILIGKTSF